MHQLGYLARLEVLYFPCLEFVKSMALLYPRRNFNGYKYVGAQFQVAPYLYGEFPVLNHVHLEGCRSSASMSVGQVTSVTD